MPAPPRPAFRAPLAPADASALGAVRPRAVGALHRAGAGLVRDARRAASRASRRGPLRRDRARDGGDRRLGDAAPQRPQVFREAAVPVLAHGRRLSRVRRARVDGAPVARARRLPRRARDRRRRATRWAASRSAPMRRSRSRRCVWHAGIAQIVTLDSGLSFFLALGFAALVIAQRAETGAHARRTWMWVAAAALAGATLSKGLIGLVLPGGALVVYTMRRRATSRSGGGCHIGSGLVVYLALTAPWFVAVALANDEFLRFFFIHEHFERFLTNGSRPPGAVVLLRAVACGRHAAVAHGPGRGPRARVARRRAQRARLLVAALRARRGPRSSSCSSARRGRSCRPTSCRCSRRWRSSPRWLLVRLDIRTLHAPARAARRRRHRAGAGFDLRLRPHRARASRPSGCRPRFCSTYGAVPQGGGERRRGSAALPQLLVFRAGDALAPGTVHRPLDPVADRAGRPADRHRRIRRVEPDALVLGYPPVCAAGGALRRRRALLPGRDVRSDGSLLSRPRDARSSRYRDELALGIDAEPRQADPDARARGSPSGSRCRRATR